MTSHILSKSQSRSFALRETFLPRASDAEVEAAARVLWSDWDRMDDEEHRVLLHLFNEAAANPGYRLTIDLAAQTVTTPAGKAMRFDIDATRKENLLNGLDEIGLTLRHADDIRAYEEKRKRSEPWIFS